MKLTKKSILTGIEHTIELPIGKDTYELGIFYHDNGMFIQDAFPTLNADEREFILTGVTADEWNDAFPEDNQ